MIVHFVPEEVAHASLCVRSYHIPTRDKHDRVNRIRSASHAPVVTIEVCESRCINTLVRSQLACEKRPRSATAWSPG